jgi:predicted metal-dependent HD superfamily phosphohydrolase
MDDVDQPPPDPVPVPDSLTSSWPLEDGEGVRDALLEAYADPSRGYHDTRHLAEVLARLGELAENGTLFDRVPVALAAWFHDAIYDGERDAEERSAAWTEDALADLTAPGVVAEAARLVRLTETHRPDDGDANGCALSDADLAILAAPPERYAEYVVNVRREYSHLSDDVFEAGRAGVLRALLAKPQLFHTAYALKHWEDAARTNMEAELAHLPATDEQRG